MRALESPSEGCHRDRRPSVTPLIAIGFIEPEIQVIDTESRHDLDEEFVATLRLALIAGVGPRTRRSLLDRFGTSLSVLSASRSELLEVDGVGSKLAEAIGRAVDEVDVEGHLAICRERDVRVLTDIEPEFPRLLKEIHDPPAMLFVRGELKSDDALSIAIVGTRHATQYGLRQAERLSAGLSRAGLTIVSGLARGIDAAAHRGALEAAGRTIAVLGSGVLNVYPPEHQDLAAAVISSGALVSEAPPLHPPKGGSFPQRNRLITGMSLGLIVIEASLRSGALISARLAMEQGREVFALPGNVDSRASHGCHRLIRDGAKLVETVDDVLEELGPLVESAPLATGQVVRHPAELKLNEQEQAVLTAIGEETASIDEVIVRSRLPTHRVLATISVLEMRRLIRRAGGNRVARM